MPALLHQKGKAPHIVAMCAANTVAGGVQLITGDTPQNILHTAPQYIATLWSLLLLLGGVISLVGIFIKCPIIGLRIEAAGHVGIVGGALVYVVAALQWMDPPWWASPAVWWAIALSVASFIRWAQIWRLMHKASRRARGEE